MASEPLAGLLRPPDNAQEGHSKEMNTTQQQPPSNSSYKIKKSSKIEASMVAISNEQWCRIHEIISQIESGAIRVIDTTGDEVVQPNKKDSGENRRTSTAGVYFPGHPHEDPSKVQFSNDLDLPTGSYYKAIPARIATESPPVRPQNRTPYDDIRDESITGDCSPHYGDHFSESPAKMEAGITVKEFFGNGEGGPAGFEGQAIYKPTHNNEVSMLNQKAAIVISPSNSNLKIKVLEDKIGAKSDFEEIGQIEINPRANVNPITNMDMHKSQNIMESNPDIGQLPPSNGNTVSLVLGKNDETQINAEDKSHDSDKNKDCEGENGDHLSQQQHKSIDKGKQQLVEGLDDTHHRGRG